MDTFGRAYTHRRRLRTDVSPLPWLHKVALNLCYTRLGRRRLRERAGHGHRRGAPRSTAAPGPTRTPSGPSCGQIVREGIAGLSRQAPVGRDPVLPRGPLAPGDRRRARPAAGHRQEPDPPRAARPARAPARRPPLRRRLGRGRARRPRSPAGRDRAGRSPAGGTARCWSTSSTAASAARGRPPPSTTSRAASAARQEMTELALTIVALRRAGREIAAFPVPARASRAAVPSPARAATGGPGACRLGGLLTCAAIVGLVVLPHGPASISPGDATAPVSRSAVATPWHRGRARLAASPDVAPVAAVGNLPPRYPDGLTQAVEGGASDRRHAARSSSLREAPGPFGPPRSARI